MLLSYHECSKHPDLTEMDEFGNGSVNAESASTRVALILGMLQRMDVADIADHRMPMAMASAGLYSLQQSLCFIAGEFPFTFGDKAQCTCDGCKMRWISTLTGAWAALLAFKLAQETPAENAGRNLLGWILSRQVQEAIYTYETLSQRLLTARSDVLALLAKDTEIEHWRGFTNFTVAGRPWWLDF